MMTSDSLGLIYSAWQKTEPDQRYALIARIRDLVAKKPELKANRDHPVFLEATQWHIAQMKVERRELATMLKARLENGDMAYLPTPCLNSYNAFNEDLGRRIDQLTSYIQAYSENITQRKIGVILQ